MDKTDIAAMIKNKKGLVLNQTPLIAVLNNVLNKFNATLLTDHLPRGCVQICREMILLKKIALFSEEKKMIFSVCHHY
ncbi:hypothetical protein B6N60_04445 [Richelia sinica FACHB-800]|uniref:Uncharacterized protein n=1 Tax=Richelia sinica FACHB-800 TaxID=1357546 RepID=A0A975Y6X1_9NOST|nr:hypothetical protein [Richelia sinica]MBD2665423.1 hypothetical protein [Richelia sinica FACHB-800]QXE25725.1 hypothetical protein B6N60_04445 [Richelia sinica FACHB-800]